MLDGRWQGKRAGSGRIVCEGRRLLAEGRIDYDKFIARAWTSNCWAFTASATTKGRRWPWSAIQLTSADSVLAAKRSTGGRNSWMG